MIEPKTFYRELDEALANISKTKSDKNFYITILRELRQKFGEMLLFDNSYIYEMRGDLFVCVNAAGKQSHNHLLNFPANSQFAQAIIKNGSYIFNHTDLTDLDASICQKNCIPAAIHIYHAESQWIFIFELKNGWIREEITLFLNSVRTALNYRLISEKVKSEFEQAAQIQRSLLPRHPPEVKEYRIAQRSLAAELVGGDFFEYFQFHPDHLGFAIGDASGHGIPAALLVRDVVIGLRMSLNRDIRISHTINQLNRVIQRSTYSTHFISLFVGEMEEPGHLVYVNAGHPPPFLVHNQTVTALEESSIVLGFLADIDLHRNFIYMEPNSTLVLYTDGIVERNNQKEEQYGLDKLKKLVLENEQKDPAELIELIYQDVYNFGGQSNWEDDASMLIIRRTD